MIQLGLFEWVYAVLFSKALLIKNMHFSLRDVSFAAI